MPGLHLVRTGLHAAWFTGIRESCVFSTICLATSHPDVGLVARWGEYSPAMFALFLISSPRDIRRTSPAPADARSASSPVVCSCGAVRPPPFRAFVFYFSLFRGCGGSGGRDGLLCEHIEGTVASSTLSMDSNLDLRTISARRLAACVLPTSSSNTPRSGTQAPDRWSCRSSSP